MADGATILYAVPTATRPEGASGSGLLLGDGPPMRRLLALLDRIGDSDASVLITGESGSGKELVARAIHTRSRQCDGPFVAVNCAALPASLLESELFGHVRGAFTDAKQSHDGIFVQAGSGTVFLDEVGDMPLEMQAKLLRVVEQRVVRPVGSDSELPVRARLVTATNRHLEADVAAGRFRHDLYFRINVLDVAVPPLRDREEDIPLLARHFAEVHARRLGRDTPAIGESVVRHLIDYPWPGNVRELENAIHRAVCLSRQSEIALDDLPTRIREHRSTRLAVAGDNPDQLFSLAEMERRYIRRTLAAVGGNKARAARILGLDRRTLYRRIETLGVEATACQAG